MVDFGDLILLPDEFNPDTADGTELKYTYKEEREWRSEAVEE